MKLNLILLFASLASFSSCFAAEQSISAEESAASLIRTYYNQPCSFWRYNNGSYTCSSPGVSFNAADGTDTQNAVQTLENRNRTLEERIKKLEGNQ